MATNNKMTNKEMMAEILANMVSINQRFDKIEERLSKLESPKKPTVSEKNAREKKEKDERTFREKKADWAKEKYTEEERKAYGEQKKAERAKQKKAYEEANKCFKEKVDYKVWKAKYNEILASL